MVKKVIRFIVLIIGLSLVAYSGYHLFKIFWDYRTSDKTYEKLQDAYTVDDSKKSDDNDSEAADTPWYDDIDIDFAGLRSENPDVVGWIYFENEDISYPVMYSGDNSYYLRKTFNREHATAGSIFLEGSNKTDFGDCHTIIYGHNMKNLSMFGKLKYYNRDENYYDSHQYFQILVDGKKYRYRIFSYETVSDDSDEYTVGFEPDETFGKFVQRMAASSMKDTGIVPTKDDKVVTLSTCSTSGETYRFVVHGVRVDEH
ncbi:SrtB family sortase [Agathobacter rectalis]|jgi:sortase B|uniref:SrtB family sortase n=1 Tax=Agathobacter rectalis TaxID=39491 RepID=A0A414IWI1_9FIRM|nr:MULTISPECIES: class B sortase [Agathobacter]RGT13056.1 SrtB family sortase [Agathobacter rectalis]RGT20757.1 SrtB family sortase [Agathobacter rectalis]RGZ76964.1 SrtB family sortase [Agathobacter rectalis]RHE33666.1 SrtB family sortase [Agathobacter rectalis]RHG24952.1 SrtB family sortase [Agathobacter rectalis]